MSRSHCSNNEDAQKAMLQLVENKAEHREPCLPFLFPTTAFLHRALRKPTIINYQIETCCFKKISFYVGLGTSGCDKIAMYKSQCIWAFSLHFFFLIIYSEMEFLSHSAAESSALIKPFPERLLTWWEQAQMLQIFSVSFVQSRTVFSKISPVLFSEVRSCSYQIKILFQIGPGYTGLFFQHTTGSILVPIGPPKEMPAVITQTMSMSSIIKALRKRGRTVFSH